MVLGKVIELNEGYKFASIITPLSVLGMEIGVKIYGIFVTVFI